MRKFGEFIALVGFFLLIAAIAAGALWATGTLTRLGSTPQAMRGQFGSSLAFPLCWRPAWP